MTITTPSALENLFDPRYLAAAIKACRQNKSLTEVELASLANIPVDLVYGLEAGQAMAIDATNVLRLLELIFPEQFYKHNIDEYSQRITRINQQQLTINHLVDQNVIYDSDFTVAAGVIVTNVAKTLAAEYVGIWLFAEQETLSCFTVYASAADEAQLARYRQKTLPDHFACSRSMRTRVTDFTRPSPDIDAFARQQIAEWGVTVALSTTIYLHDEPLGLLFTEHVGDKRLWHSDEVAFHGEVASLVALAYMNAESKSDRDLLLEKQRLYHGAIFELSRVEAIITGDIAVAVPIILEKVTQVLNVGIAGIWLMSDGQDVLLGLDEYENGTKQHQRPNNYPRKNYPRFFQAIEQERVVVVNDVCNDPRVNEDLALFISEGISSLLCVAVRAQGKIVAVLSIEHKGTAKPWLPDEIAFSGEVSEQVAQLVINYKNVQKKKNTDRRYRVEKNCQQAHKNLLESSQFEQADHKKSIEEICRLLSEVLEVEYVGVHLLDAGKRSFNGVALYQMSKKDFTYSGDYTWEEGCQYYQLLANQKSFVCNDSQADERLAEFDYLHTKFDICALIDVAICSGTEMLGMLSVENVNDKRQWLDEEVALCLSAAEKINTILDRNVKHKTEQAYQQQLQREKIQNQAILSLLKGKASIDNDRHKTIEEVCKLTAEVLKVEYVGVYLFDNKKECLFAESLYQLSTQSFWLDEDDYTISAAHSYYQELEEYRTLTSIDCLNDDRLKDFVYLENEGIRAVADTVIRVNGVSVGVLNIEHTELREWYKDEVAYMGAVADHVAQVMLADKMRQDSDAYATVAKRREELEHMINHGQFVLIDWVGESWKVRFISESVNQFGYAASDFYNDKVSFFDRIHADDAGDINRRLKAFQVDKNTDKLSFEYRLLTADGEVRWIEELAQVVHDNETGVDRHYSVIHDVTSRKLIERSLLESKEKMQRMAFYDALTGLENRALFKQQLEHAIKASHRQKKPVALLYLDIDNFKMVNDTLGHDAGDMLLKIVADRLLACVREDDTVARIGGDEFTVLLTEVKGRSGAKRAAEKIIEVFTKPIKLNDKELIISPSIGITLCPEDGVDSTLLMKDSDLAMYRAKSLGRNNFQFYTDDMNSEVSKRVQLEAELRQALSSKQFELYFQPIIDLSSLRCVGVEALVRWHHPERGLVPPDEFIPVAEDTGLIIPLGEQIFAMACEQAVVLKQAGLSAIKIAVNLSARQFHDPNLIAMVKQYIDDFGLEARQLGLEVTESLLMDKVENAIVTLKELKALGFSLSIDDFGTGYSSLSYLKRLPIDTVKVDRSFVRDIPQDRNDMEITAAVIAMAHKLNLNVIAEGVEELEQQRFLIENDCNFAQGYYYSRPVPGSELVAVVDKMLGEGGEFS